MAWSRETSTEASAVASSEASDWRGTGQSQPCSWKAADRARARRLSSGWGVSADQLPPARVGNEGVAPLELGQPGPHGAMQGVFQRLVLETEQPS